MAKKFKPCFFEFQQMCQYHLVNDDAEDRCIQPGLFGGKEFTDRPCDTSTCAVWKRWHGGPGCGECPRESNVNSLSAALKKKIAAFREERQDAENAKK